MNDSCLRCGQPLARDVRHCAGCGADRELELAVAAQLVPTIGSLRRWLCGLGVLQIALSALTYEHFRKHLLDTELWRMVLPGMLSGTAFLALAAAAHRVPLAAAMIASLLFGTEWLLQIVADPAAALAPSIGLAFRVVLSFVLVTAVRAAWRAASLRKQANRAVRLPVARVVEDALPPGR